LSIFFTTIDQPDEYTVKARISDDSQGIDQRVGQEQQKIAAGHPHAGMLYFDEDRYHRDQKRPDEVETIPGIIIVEEETFAQNPLKPCHIAILVQQEAG
jgi:hypothetical protein